MVARARGRDDEVVSAANRIEEPLGGLGAKRPHPDRGYGPLLLCYDGSEAAKYAIKTAGSLLALKQALVLTVWEPSALLASFGWSGAPGGVDFVELDRAAADNGGRIADEGVRIAQEEHMEAHAVSIKATGPVWKTIVGVADDHDAAAIVIGTRGLSAVNRMLLGSVSTAVLHHTARPTLVIDHPGGGDAD